MAGHIKCAEVKRRKAVVDAGRGKLFSQVTHEITVAAKVASGEANINSRLRMVLLKCLVADQFMKLALDTGAVDFTGRREFEILTEPAKFEAVHQKIKVAGIKTEAAEAVSLPAVTVPLIDSAAGGVGKLIAALEEHGDVKEVFLNAEFSEAA